MEHSFLTIERKMLAPRSNMSMYLEYRDGNVILSIPAIYSNHCVIEVYEVDSNSGYEWRIVEMYANEIGDIRRKVVLYDSFEAIYSDPYIALSDAVLFSMKFI